MEPLSSNLLLSSYQPQTPVQPISPIYQFAINQFKEIPIFSFLSRVAKEKDIIYSFLSPTNIGHIRSLNRQERAIVDEKYPLSIEITKLLDRLSTLIKNKGKVIDILDLVSQEESSEEVKKLLKYAKVKADQIQAPTSKAGALKAIAIEQAKIDVPAAKETANQIQLPSYKAGALKAIAMEQAKIDVPGAKETLELAKEVVKQHQYIPCRVNALIAIAMEQIKVDVPGAKETLKLAKEAANQIQNSYSKSENLKAIAIEQAKIDVRSAIETADQIQNLSLKQRL
jgi:hypothetical protein